MILRKPYAMFIRLFKPIHIIASILIAYLIYLSSRILEFLNSYIYSNSDIGINSIKDKYISSLIFIIPIIIIVLSLVILGIMVRKKKPVTFYVVNIFSYIAVIVISVYTSNFLGILEANVVSLGIVKLIHDLVLINILIESVTFIFFVIRGMGINFKKFDFDSEISKFDINESDKEEFEFDVNIDLSETRRRRKKNIRFLKYKYKENKFKINIMIAIIFVLIVIGIGSIIISNGRVNHEGKVYNINGLNIGVNDTTILNTDYRGVKITDNYLIVVNAKMQSFNTYRKVYLNDFSLKIGEAIFKPSTKYSKHLLDIGNTYIEGESLKEYNNYLFIYEIPEKYTKSTMIFSYNIGGETLDISLDPKDLISNNTSLSKNITEEINFKDTIGDIGFKINNFDLEEYFEFKYEYCIDKYCINSKEYMRPSLNQNFDKVILRVDVNYFDNSELNINSFYKFLSRFGSIEYKIKDKWYLQSNNFEELKSNKTNTGSNAYIGVKSDIIDADEIRLLFNIRGSKYEYILK